MPDFRPGQVLLAKSLTTQDLEKGSPKGSFKVPPADRMVVMYMGTVNAETVQGFTPEGVLMSIGFGPIVWSSAIRRLVAVLREARQICNMAGGEFDEAAALLPRIDEALAGVAAFEKATSREAVA